MCIRDSARMGSELTSAGTVELAPKILRRLHHPRLGDELDEVVGVDGGHAERDLGFTRTNQAAPPVVARSSLPGSAPAIARTSSSVGMPRSVGRTPDSVRRRR